MRAVWFVLVLGGFIPFAPAFGKTLQCKSAKGSEHFLVVTDREVMESTSALFLEPDGKTPNEFKTLYDSSYFAKDEKANTLTFIFADASPVDWTKVPKKECYAPHGDYRNLSQLRRNNMDIAGDYVAEYFVSQHFEKRPDSKDCKVPNPRPGEPQLVVCNPIPLF